METPFNMIIVGMTCGKTKYLLDMLEKEFHKHFDYIFLTCPTFQWNKTYENYIAVPCDQINML